MMMVGFEVRDSSTLAWQLTLPNHEEIVVRCKAYSRKDNRTKCLILVFNPFGGIEQQYQYKSGGCAWHKIRELIQEGQ